MSDIFLKSGAHASLDQGGCAMEFVAWMAGEAHSDEPECVSPVIGAFVRPVNDQLTDVQRQRLIPVLLDTIGTNTGPEDDRTRGYLCADWACRVAAQWWLRRAGRAADAERLEALPPVVDVASAKVAQKADAAYAAADAAAAAAAAAAREAFWEVNLPSAITLIQRMCAVGRKAVPVEEERVAQWREQVGAA